MGSVSAAIMIKTLLTTFLVVAAKAEADAHYGVPFGSSTGLDPITQGLDASTQGLAPYTLHGVYGKRSADADASYGHIGFGSSTGLDPITQGLDASTQGFAPYAHHGYGLHGVLARDLLMLTLPTA